MRNVQDTFETCKRSFISAFSICVTVPLKEGHLANTCSEKYSCRKCHGRHNIAICTFSKPAANPANSNNQLSLSNNLSHNKNNILL